MSSVTVDLAGAQTANGGTTASANAFGMTGGNGNDGMVNAGAVTIDISSVVDGSSNSVTLAGAGTAHTRGTATTTVVGMDGGDGNDTLSNYSTGSMLLKAIASGTASSYSLTFAGVANSSVSAGTEAAAHAYGMQAGGGGDFLYNYGTIDLAADAQLTASGTSYTALGKGSANSSSTASAEAIGMDGGDGNDIIVNNNDAVVGTEYNLKVKAKALAESTNCVGVFIGGTYAAGISTATTSATGIDGGEGDNMVFNHGTMDVLADTDATVSATATPN